MAAYDKRASGERRTPRRYRGVVKEGSRGKRYRKRRLWSRGTRIRGESQA
jgi:hypothetical protein